MTSNTQQQVTLIQDHLLTPYGPPSPQAYVIPVPNECVGLIIGKGGEMIRALQLESGAKIQVAKSMIPDTSQRNVFVEGPLDKYDLAKQLIDSIIDEHFKLASSVKSLISANNGIVDFEMSNSDQKTAISQNNNCLMTNTEMSQADATNIEQGKFAHANMLIIDLKLHLISYFIFWQLNLATHRCKIHLLFNRINISIYHHQHHL